MLVSALISWCNSMYEPDTTDYKLSDSTWIAFFNEALVDLKPYLFLRETATADIINETTSYGLPTDFYKMHQLLIKQKSTDEYYKIYKLLRVNDVYSTGYRLWETTLEIYPEPTEDVTDGLKMYYWKTHPELSETDDEILISDPYAVGIYALYRIEQSDRTSKSTDYYRQYEEKIKRLKLNQPEYIDDYLIEDVY